MAMNSKKFSNYFYASLGRSSWGPWPQRAMITDWEFFIARWRRSPFFRGISCPLGPTKLMSDPRWLNRALVIPIQSSISFRILVFQNSILLDHSDNIENSNISCQTLLLSTIRQKPKIWSAYPPKAFVGRIISRCMQTEEKPVVNYRELLRLKSEGTIWIYAMIQVLEMRFFRFT